MMSEQSSPCVWLPRRLLSWLTARIAYPSNLHSQLFICVDQFELLVRRSRLVPCCGFLFSSPYDPNSISLVVIAMFLDSAALLRSTLIQDWSDSHVSRYLVTQTTPASFQKSSLCSFRLRLCLLTPSETLSCKNFSTRRGAFVTCTINVPSANR